MILSKLREHVLADIHSGNAVLLVSESGRGKSDFAEALFRHLKKATQLNWGFQTLFLATQTPPDLIGYQFKGTGEYNGRTFAKSEASIPLWMMSNEGKPAWAYDRYFLFLDEYGQGEADVKRSAAELFLKGQIGPWALPPYSVRLAASNKGARYGVTKDFDFVVARQSRYNITDDIESWLDWADRPYTHEGREWNVMPVTKAFAKQNPTVLFEDTPKEQGPWCNPRTLCATDRYLQEIERVKGKVDANDHGVAEGVAAKIGVPAAGALMGWLQFRLELPQYEDVVKDPTGTPVPNKPDMQMVMAYEMASRTHKEDLAKVIAYMQRMPKDLAITYAVSLVRRDSTMVLERPLAAWTAKNATLLALIQSLS